MAQEPLFSGKSRVRVNSINIAERFDLRPLDSNHCLAIAPMTIAAGRDGCAVLFRYGVVVLFGLDSLEEVSFLANLKNLVQEPDPSPINEETELRLDPEADDRMDGNAIVLRAPNPDRLQVIASILAKSVKLERYEASIKAGFDQIEPLAVSLQQLGKARLGARKLLQNIGNALLIEHKMVNRMEIEEKPELLWDRPDLEPLYLHLENEFELRDRLRVLERKLDLVSRTVETVLDLLNHKRSLRVEWYIVLLIVVEIGLTLYEMFIR